MKYPGRNEELKRDLDRRMTKGHGELVQITWTELEEMPVAGETTGTDKLELALVPVDKTASYYVGKMTLGQTGTVVAVLASMVVTGLEMKNILGNNLAFINALEENQLAVLLSALVGEAPPWIKENFDLGWAVEVLRTFLKYNDFFALGGQVMKLTQKWGLTPEKVKALRIG